MTIQSKYPSKCTACGCAIKVGENVEWRRGVQGVRHETINACSDAKKAAIAAKASPVTINLKKIADFLTAAKARGLKSPKLRVLDIDGKTELRLGITSKGVAPGSISVVRGFTFYGCIRPDGTTTSIHLQQDAQLQQHLLKVSEDPAAAAKEYAALMGLCSFCGKSLTDEGSVEVGYGPICAKHWGLPHKALGTPVLSAVPGV